MKTWFEIKATANVSALDSTALCRRNPTNN